MRVENPLDSIETSLYHRRVLSENELLRQAYEQFYQFLLESIPLKSEFSVVEIGTGGGFLAECCPELITTDIACIPDILVACSATSLPFEKASVSAIVMLNVLHHLHAPELFFREASRVLKPHGVIAMVEPASTLFSSFIYRYLHHENFDPTVQEWGFEKGGRLSSANGALPWILFHRDREKFVRQFPELSIEMVENFMPFQYLLSGGFSYSPLIPSFLYRPLIRVEKMLHPFRNLLGMCMKIRLVKR